MNKKNSSASSELKSDNSKNKNPGKIKKGRKFPVLSFMKRLITAALILIIVAISATAAINIHMLNSTRKHIIEANSVASAFGEADCILILGASVHPDGTPSTMLRDRLDRGIELYNLGIAPKLLMSGDNGTAGYNEVAAMKLYAINAGVPSEDIFSDHAGFSTYESMYRLKEIFGADRVVIVTQRYHLYRALYIADRLHIQACGAAALDERYAGQFFRDLREFAARNKDFITCILKPLPKYLGDPISLEGDGNIT